MAEQDETKQILEKLLSDLYSRQAAAGGDHGDSYLIGEDGQFLGRISPNSYSSDSILNSYGPYGSPYSNTSIFNDYSPYGSPYGQYSVNNPYSTTPPKLFIQGKLLGRVTKNQYVPSAIPTESFLSTLKNDMQGLLAGRIIRNHSEARRKSGESFIAAEDGTFLGNLRPNRYDQDSIFNTFGPYGSKYSQTSIFNRFGTYGNAYSLQSPYNRATSTPPKVFHEGRFVAYLTANKRLNPRILPDEIQEWARKNVRKYG
jgi:hypothetical protein